MEIKITIIPKEDLKTFTNLIGVFEKTFEWENYLLPDIDYLRKVLINPNFISVVAKIDDEVVGGLTAYIFEQYYSQQPLAYIYDLAVLPQFQRHGIGKKLMAFITEYCTQHNFEEIFVQAEDNDLQAVNFYRATPISGEEKIFHFMYRL